MSEPKEAFDPHATDAQNVKSLALRWLIRGMVEYISLHRGWPDLTLRSNVEEMLRLEEPEADERWVKAIAELLTLDPERPAGGSS